MHQNKKGSITMESVAETQPTVDEANQPKVAPKHENPSLPKWKPKPGGINITKAYKWLNERHFVVVAAGKTWVANIPRNDNADITLSSFSDFEKWYQNQFVETLDGEGKISRFYPAGTWLSWEKRHQRTGIVLDPRSPYLTDPFAYNLWHGFGIPDVAGDWDTIRWHLHYVVCAGNEQHFQWLLHWMAYCVHIRNGRQRPPLSCAVARERAKASPPRL